MSGVKRFCRTLAVFVLVCTILTADIMPAAALTWADVNALKDEASELGTKRKELESKLRALSNDKSKVLDRKDLLDQQMDALASEIGTVERQIAAYQQLIIQTKTELETAQQREADQYELFCQRVRAMEENGQVSYWSVLFKAQDFSDLLSRLDFINEVMEYDQGVIADLQKLQEEISAKQADLETQLAEEKEAKVGLVERKSQLGIQRTEANALAVEIEENEDAYAATLKAIEKEEDEVQDRIVQLSRELAAKNNQGAAALGGYIWPVSSHKINSFFGKRNTGIKGASKNHKGIDIGRVGYNSVVSAAKAGTVIVSQRSSSYGEYVVVSHGGGNTTLYAHMSSRKVSVGQSVTQGQQLGITGSTGISSGPHLHFEITENGARINPLKYLTNYTS